jgi:hypothetical protein
MAENKTTVTHEEREILGYLAGGTWYSFNDISFAVAPDYKTFGDTLTGLLLKGLIRYSEELGYKITPNGTYALWKGDVEKNEQPEAPSTPPTDSAKAADVEAFKVGDIVRFRYGTTPLTFRGEMNGRYGVETEDGTVIGCDLDDIVPPHATSNWGRAGYDADGFLIDATPEAAPTASETADSDDAKQSLIVNKLVASNEYLESLLDAKDAENHAQAAEIAALRAANDALKAERDSLRAEREMCVRVFERIAKTVWDADVTCQEQARNILAELKRREAAKTN